MNTPELLNELHRLDIRVAAEGDRLVYDAPHGTLTPELRAQLRAHKTALLQYLHESEGEVVPVEGVKIAHDLPLSKLLADRRVVRVRSRHLGEVVIWAADDAEIPPDKTEVTYRESDLRRVVGMSPEQLQAVHAVKRGFDGELAA